MRPRADRGWTDGIMRSIVMALCSSTTYTMGSQPMWIEAPLEDKDYYVAFRGSFSLEHATEIEVCLLGASWYVAWIDNNHLAEGPFRFPIDHPEYQTHNLQLVPGRHVLALQVHHVGEETRMLPAMRPFLRCDVLLDGSSVPITWKATRLDGYESQVRRINPILSWIEWCDTRAIPRDWQAIDFDDAAWLQPATVQPSIGTPQPATIGDVQRFEHLCKPIAEGPLANVYGYERDDIPARFFLRDQICEDYPPQGRWFRYDLGRIRLGRPRFTMNLPAGAVVEFAYAETLHHGRVAPYINLSTGPSCNLDHYIARGGRQTFMPLTPRSGRFMELHVFAEPDAIDLIEQEFIERAYHGPSIGSLETGDELLDCIWTTGIETYRACTEDAVVDNPTRERGQWTGDVVSVGMDIASVGYSDLRLLRRGLVQAAQCAREDGLVAGLSPGNLIYVATYACQWASACMHYYELTGDRTLLQELYPAALRNMSAFEPYIKDHGLEDGAGWVFIDWGYVRNDGPADMAYNMHYLAAVEAMIRWADIFDKPDDRARVEQRSQHFRKLIRTWLDEQLTAGPDAWKRIGYHRSALALSLGLVDDSQQPECIEAMKHHILNCFPNRHAAPRLSDPTQSSAQLITPYFAHFAFPPLIDHGEMDFVLDQYRNCWGWALEDDRTTWVEVFDPRWSHCHQWSGSPTWQLSRYLLGLHTRFDLGKNHYEFKLHPGALRQVSGTLPLPGQRAVIRVEWKRQGEAIRYRVEADSPIQIHDLPDLKAGNSRIVKRDLEIAIPFRQ